MKGGADVAHDVFISYSTEDKAIADAMCHYLEHHGLRCWMAPRDVRPGEDYAAEIIDAIAASRALVLVFSANANNSKHVKNEVERGVSHGIPVIPFRTQDVQPAKSLELFLGARHWLDAMTRPLAVHFEKLAHHLQIIAGTPAAGNAAGTAGATVGTAEPAALATFSPPPAPGRFSPALRWLALALIPVLSICAVITWIGVSRGRGVLPASQRNEPAKIATPAPAVPRAPDVAAVVVAKTLDLPAKEVTSSIGMKMLLISAGQFMMGNSHSLEQEVDAFKPYYEVKLAPAIFTSAYPRHRVRITRPFYLGICHVTRGQFRHFVDATGYKTDAEKSAKGAAGYNGSILVLSTQFNWRNTGFAQTDEHPVLDVSWNDAMAFCRWLSRKEGKTYRLPSEAQWEYACRAGTTTRYYSGDDPESLVQVGNVADSRYKTQFAYTKALRASDGYTFTAPVGQFRPNAFGLFDMHGNAFELCSDWYATEYYAAAAVDDPAGPVSGASRVARGGSWLSPPERCTSAYRASFLPAAADVNLGFRVACESPQGGLPAGKTFTNSLGMKFALIPAGEFLMGDSHALADELQAFEPYDNTYPVEETRCEYPRHRVRITRPFYLGIYHVTRGQFGRFVDATGYKTDAEKNGKGGQGYDGHALRDAPQYNWRNTGFAQTDEHPVVNVSWNDAIAFCDWLSRKEDKKYRLPTEAEWEYACRAGTTTRYWCGDDPETLAEVANVADAACKAKFPAWTTIRASDGYTFTSPSGTFPPNAFGLFDMHGNAWQLCWDWYGAEYYAVSSGDDPSGPDSGICRVARGGSWYTVPNACASSARFGLYPVHPTSAVGFRVARTP